MYIQLASAWPVHAKPYLCIGIMKHTLDRNFSLRLLSFAAVSSWVACHNRAIALHLHCRQTRAAGVYPCHNLWSFIRNTFAVSSILSAMIFRDSLFTYIENIRNKNHYYWRLQTIFYLCIFVNLIIISWFMIAKVFFGMNIVERYRISNNKKKVWIKNSDWPDMQE